MSEQLRIQVWADWAALGSATMMGELMVAYVRGKQIFSFEYRQEWLDSGHAQTLDPDLAFFKGKQYADTGRENFGVFLDSSPDRWGRVLMKRREAQRARAEGRQARPLLSSDFLLGVHDSHRMGALRFKTSDVFLDNSDDMAAPPMTSLRELEHASQQLERDDAEDDPDFSKWIGMLIAPGGSLGGARPKASVHDPDGHLWIAKFPSVADEDNIGLWEAVVHQLATDAGITVPDAMVKSYGGKHHTFLSSRFDREPQGARLHFASAMTLVGGVDGEGGSYLDLVQLLTEKGANTEADLRELWRRIIFSICVSNTDDHLRNHGFLLCQAGWLLAPAYDLNPNAGGEGLCLNISQTDNSQNLDLAREVAKLFRLKGKEAGQIIDDVVTAVQRWRKVGNELGLSRSEMDRMQRAFRVVA